MSAISGFINTIRNAVYGEQVRGAIVSALEQCYSDVNNPSLNTEAFSAAIEAAYANGFLDIQEKSTFAGMTNEEIIYRYTGTEAGKEKGLYYFSKTSNSWVLIATTDNVSNMTKMDNGQLNSPNIWEQGNIISGSNTNAANRIRTKTSAYLTTGNGTISVVCGDGYEALDVAFSSSGAFVGVWNGSGYALDGAVYRQSFDISSDNYRHRFVIKKSTDSNISVSEYIHINITGPVLISTALENYSELTDSRLQSLETQVNERTIKNIYSYDELISKYSYERNKKVTANNMVGRSVDDAIASAESDSAVIFVDVTDVTRFSYPLFQSSENAGCLLIDEYNIILWEFSNNTLPLYTEKEVVIADLNLETSPKYFVFYVSNSLYNNPDNWDFTIYETINKTPVVNVKTLNAATLNYLPYMSTLKSNLKKSLCLCSIKTEIENNKIPFASGYLFHEIGANSSNKLYFGTKLDNAEEIGTPAVNPRDCLVAVSPKDGRVIFTKRGVRGAMYIWDGENTTTLFSDATLKPRGWLYNSGVDFIVDENDIEHCIFAEYTPDVSGVDGFYVWRGTYPYTSESDWETVFYMNQSYSETANTITHFHMVRRDPWTNILYLTSGDKPKQLRWWYSTDYGQNWTLLTDNATNGWEEHVCRCINFIFTKDYIYWGVDFSTNHTLNRIQRDDTTGLIDITTRERLANIGSDQATNSICYIDAPRGIFVFNRTDEGLTQPVELLFWDIEQEQLFNLGNIYLTQDTWGGHRGKCYTNYCSGQEPRPAMGFSADTPCIFDIVGASSGLGTIYYDL